MSGFSFADLETGYGRVQYGWTHLEVYNGTFAQCPRIYFLTIQTEYHPE